jgi:hypothetical protein
MTFLELVQRTRRECGIPGDGPTTTANQTREMRRLVDWVSQAYVELQEERSDWDFLRKPTTFNTQHGTSQSSGDTVYSGNVYEIVTRTTTDFDSIGILYTGASNTPGATYYITTTTVLGSGDSTTLAGKQSYSVGSGATYDINLSDFAKWRSDSFRSYLKSAGIATQIILSQYYNYSDFRDFYLLGSRQLVTARPLYITVAPDRSLVLGFTPNDIYVVTGEYYRTPQVLSADADIPLMPDRFHMAIVYKAMMKYGLFESAAEQIEAGKAGYSMIANRLMAEYTPIIQNTSTFI